MKTLPSNHRNAELAMIHIGKQQIGMDDATYRDMLWACGRVRSSKDLDYAGRQKVIDHLKKCGFIVVRPKAGKNHPGRPHNIDSEARGPQLRKIEALLADAGREWAYVDSMALRMFQVARVSLCHEGQLQKIIAALSIDQKRRVGQGVR